MTTVYDIERPDATQLAICEKYGLPPTPPGLRVAIALATLGQSPIYGTRINTSEPGAISWFIHCGEYSSDVDFYQVLHTWHLPEELPQVIRFLFLPECSHFITDRDGYEDVWLEDQPLAEQ